MAQALGGTRTLVNIGGVNYWEHTFAADEPFDVNVSLTADYIIVPAGAGGGAAGSAGTGGGAGGGAGAPKVGTHTFGVGQHQVSVGQPGVGAPDHSTYGGFGGDSSIAGVASALGGAPGGGAHGSVRDGKDGGSGGGASRDGTPGTGLGVLGNDGGDGTDDGPGGGGGGATGPGGKSTNNNVKGPGGTGYDASHWGIGTICRGGDGGDNVGSDLDGPAGSNYGDGGGGGSVRHGIGGPGGPGIVKLRYPAQFDLDAGTGHYTITGKASGLAAHYRLMAAKGAYAVTGHAATLKGAYIALRAGTGSYAITGKASGQTAHYRLRAAKGGYSMAGKSASLERHLRLSAERGAYDISGSPATLETYNDWLALTAARRIVLIEATETDGTVHRWASDTYITGPNEGPANTVYRSVLLDEVTLESRLSGPYGFDGVAASGGVIRISNVDRRYDYLVNRSWGDITIYYGDPRWSVDRFRRTPMYNGRIAAIRGDAEAVEFDLADLYEDLDRPAQAVPDWYGDRVGQHRPLNYGYPLNVQPAVLGTSNPDYFVHENGTCEDPVVARYKNQAPFTSPSIVSESGSVFELGAMPGGNVTVDTKGIRDGAGNWLQHTHEALEHLLTREVLVEYGVARGGSPTTLQLDIDASDQDDYYTGLNILCVSQQHPAPPWSNPPVGSGSDIQITGYDGATRTVTISDPWRGDVSTREAGDVYFIPLSGAQAPKRVGPLSEDRIDTASFSRLGSDMPGLIGWWIANDQSVLDCLRDALSPAGYHHFTPAGKLSVGVLVDPSAAEADLRLDQSRLREGVRVAEVHAPTYELRLGYNRNWTPARGGSHDSLSNERAQFVQREYQYVTRGDDAIRQADDRAQSETVGTLFRGENAATAQADRWWSLFSVPRYTYELPAFTEPMGRRLGAIIAPDAGMYDLDGDKNLLIVGMEKELIAGTTVMEAWG